MSINEVKLICHMQDIFECGDDSILESSGSIEHACIVVVVVVVVTTRGRCAARRL